MADSSTITAADVIGNSLYAGSSSVPVYASDYKTVKYTVPAGQYICTVYSWTEPTTGGLYWMFYRTDDDFANMVPSFVKNDPGNLSLPALPDILAKLAAKKEAQEKQDKGLLQYYLDHYGAWIVGGIVVAVALPSVVRAAKSATSKGVGAVDKKAGLLLLLLIGGGAYAYSQSKKKTTKNTVIIGPLDKGEFVPDVIDTPISTPIYIDTTVYPGQAAIAGIRRRPAVPLMI